MQLKILCDMNFFGIIINTLTLALLIILIVSSVLLFLYYGLFYLRIGIHKGKKDNKKNTELHGVSVVLTVKNESEQLKENLVYLLEQDYPDFEVIVIDHVSKDYTRYILKTYQESYPNLKVVNFLQDVNMFQGKKFPLSIGIKSAKNDIILLTECSCVPKTFTWIREMVENFSPNTHFVMGYSGFKSEKTLLNAFVQYDNLAYTASSFGFALLKHPYTACGKNLSYHRSFFFDKGGFIKHYHIPTGDDDIFVNENATGKNMNICLSKDSYVVSQSKKTFKEWCHQKAKRMSTQKYYSFIDKMLLSIYPISIVLFYLSAIATLVLNNNPESAILCEIILGLIVLKLGWQILSFYQLGRRFECTKVSYFAPLFEIYFLFMNTIMYISALRNKIKGWKQ